MTPRKRPGPPLRASQGTSRLTEDAPVDAVERSLGGIARVL